MHLLQLPVAVSSILSLVFVDAAAAVGYIMVRHARNGAVCTLPALHLLMTVEL